MSPCKQEEMWNKLICQLDAQYVFFKFPCHYSVACSDLYRFNSESQSLEPFPTQCYWLPVQTMWLETKLTTCCGCTVGSIWFRNINWHRIIWVRQRQRPSAGGFVENTALQKSPYTPSTSSHFVALQQHSSMCFYGVYVMEHCGCNCEVKGKWHMVFPFFNRIWKLEGICIQNKYFEQSFCELTTASLLWFFSTSYAHLKT